LNPQHQREDINIFDFNLTAAEIALISAQENCRAGMQSAFKKFYVDMATKGYTYASTPLVACQAAAAVPGRECHLQRHCCCQVRL